MEHGSSARSAHADKGDGANTQRTPISLEELLEHRKLEQEEAARPKFISKEERAELALKQRREEVERLRASHDKDRARREHFMHRISQEREQGIRDRHGMHHGSHHAADDGIGDPRRGSTAGSSHVERYADAAEEEAAAEKAGIILTDKERQAIRERHMGTKDRNKKKLRRFVDRKFVFDWDATDDTSIDINPLYAEKHAAEFHGRGLIAGIDPKEQLKQRHFYKDYVDRRRTEQERERAQELAEMERQRLRKVQWDERHWSEKSLDEMKDRDWRIFKEDFSISTQGGNIPNPIREWNESSLSVDLKRLVGQIGYSEPTPIQRQSIPIALQNRDLIGIAETGSGKTATFVIPMLMYIQKLPRISPSNAMEGPYGLVLAPTRELALQIEQETKKFATPLGYKCVSIVGGHAVAEQSFHLRNGAEIIIATPGRLRDCLDQHVLVLNQCYYVVMDEADRMIDMNFEDDLKFILNSLPAASVKPDSEAAEDAALMTSKRYRQTTMFSATMPTAVERLAKVYLRRPAVVTVGTAGQAVERVEQRVEMISEERKGMRLSEILASRLYEPPIIIFVNQKRTVDYISKRLDSDGYKVTSLYGGKNQEQRESAIAQLRNGTKEILVATDVAGRGIDIKKVSLVVNYDMAKSIEDYVHRIGRTGRAGETGTAISFLTANDTDVYYDLRQLLQKSSRSVIPPELLTHEASRVKPGTVSQKRRHDDATFS